MNNRFYLSECGDYICRKLDGCGHYEAWTKDGSIHWEDDDRIRTWEDAKIPMHPLPYGVGGFSAEMHGQKRGSFTLNLLKCDTSKIIDPFQGNTITEAKDIVFRRKIPSNHNAAWERRLGITA